MAVIKTYYYEEGNAAKNLYPEREWQERERQRREDEKRKRRAKARKRAKVMRRNKINTVYLTLGAILLGAFFVGYVNLQNDINTSMSNISSLESQVSDLKAENQATENRINSEANLQTVKDAAINCLGMVYANSGQIVYYDMDEDDYMSQYDNIP